MSLIKYGIAAALGYYLGQPQGRKQLQQLREKVTQLSQRPQVKQLQDSARERALATKDRAMTTLARKKDTADSTGFGGRTVAEDSEAAITGMAPPAPLGRTTPPSPTPRP
jgi:hypothetical protein